MTVKFHSTEEYNEEMVKNAPEIHRNIVRVTKRARFSGTLQRLYITATHRVGDEIIRLDRYVGELQQEKKADDALYRKADAIMNALEKTAKQAGLETRAGMYDDING